MRKVLNVGGNTKDAAIPEYFGGWQHDLLDVDPSVRPDILCDARHLADHIAAGSYDAIYCSHNLEHYYRHDARRVLSGFVHALDGGGFVEIIVPDVAYVVQAMAANRLDIDDPLYSCAAGTFSCADVIYGWDKEIEESGNDFFAHKTGYSQKSLSKLLGEFFPLSVVLADNAMLRLRALAFKSEPSPDLLTQLGVPPG